MPHTLTRIAHHFRKTCFAIEIFSGSLVLRARTTADIGVSVAWRDGYVLV